MKRRVLFSAFLCGVLFLTTTAQEAVYQIKEITTLNDDGRLLYHENNEAKKPLQGKCRVIDGDHSAYMIAEFKDGMYNGAFQYFKYNKIFEEGTYSEGYKNGLYKIYYSDGKQIKEACPYTAGKINGIRKTYYTDGTLESEKGYNMSVEDGIDRRYEWQTNRKVKDMFYKDGKFEGKQLKYITEPLGNYYIRSNYRNGKLHGEYSEIYTDGKRKGEVRLQGIYEDGRKVGEWIDEGKKIRY